MRSPALAMAMLAVLSALPLAHALPDADFRAELGEQTATNALPGQAVGFTLTVRNSGGDSNTLGEIGWYVDGVLAGSTPLPLMTSGQAETFGWTWTAVAGTHAIHAYVNEGFHVPETMTANNQWNFIPVEVALPPSDIAVVALSVEHARLRTDFGDVPNPVGDRTIRVEVCNFGQSPLAASEGGVTISVAGASAGSAIVAQLGVGALDPAACVQKVVTWTPVAAFGDVDVTAAVAGGDNANPANDVYALRDFVVVGGLNRGVVLL